MADTNTPVYGFTKPENGASDDSWGTKLNANWTKTDNILGGTTPVVGIDINGGTIDGAVVGGASAAAGTFTTLVATTADINGGTADNVQVGASVPSTVVGTTVTATNFVGPIAGAVTGNVTGNTAGVHTGAVTGDVTGNITASSGSSAFNNLTISGSLDMDAGTSATITGLSAPVQGSDAATKTYVDASIASVIDNAPAALDTLNELAAAMGDDASFSTTVSNNIATKLPLAGGTLSGALAMSTNKITGLGTPTAGSDAATKAYADSVDTQKLDKSGGTMSGVIAMGANKITGMADPTAAQDAVTKSYSDTLFGSTAAAATSAANASTSEGNAATSATASANSATASANSATASANSASASAASLASFTGQYVSQSSAPSSPSEGDLWFDTTNDVMKVYSGSGWINAGSSVNGTQNSVQHNATAGQTTFSAVYDAGFVQVYLNGIRLDTGDYTASNGSSIVLGTGATVNDTVFIQSFGTFVLADHYTKTQSDARYAETGTANTFSATQTFPDASIATTKLSGTLATAQYADGSITAAKINSAVALGGPSLGLNSVIRTNSKVITSSITFAGTENGGSFGPISLNSGVVVTVTSGSTWTII